MLEQYPLPYPSQAVQTIDPELEGVCMTCLERNPQDRYMSLSDLCEALGPVIQKLEDS